MIRSRSNIVGIGRGRVVYDLGNGLVLKVARSQYGIRSNKVEAKMYKSIPSRLKKYLGVLKKHTKLWLVMKKYDRMFPNSGKYRRKLRRLKRRFKRKGIMPYEIYSSRYKEPNWSNLRLHPDGHIIVIDYGNFERSRRRRRR